MLCTQDLVGKKVIERKYLGEVFTPEDMGWRLLQHSRQRLLRIRFQRGSYTSIQKHKTSVRMGIFCLNAGWTNAIQIIKTYFIC